MWPCVQAWHQGSWEPLLGRGRWRDRFWFPPWLSQFQLLKVCTCPTTLFSFLKRLTCGSGSRRKLSGDQITLPTAVDYLLVPKQTDAEEWTSWDEDTPTSVDWRREWGCDDTTKYCGTGTWLFSGHDTNYKENVESLLRRENHYILASQMVAQVSLVD